jgi:phage major head subunit gpT-like protein
MNDLFTGFKATFQEGLGMAPDKWQQFSMTEKSNTKSEVYPMSALLASMRLWKGDRQAQNITSLKMTLSNAPYEALIEVSREDVEDDLIGHYAGAFKQLGFVASKLWSDLAVGALTAPPVWADGAAFFGTTRTYNGNAIVNKVASALDETTYAAARKTMLEYKGYDGKPLGIMPNLLIVGPKNESTAFAILKDRLKVSGTSNKAGSTDNPWTNTADYVVLPELQGDYDDYWFLCDTRNVYKPVLVQQRKMPTIIRKDGPTDDNMFYGNVIQYGVDARGAASLTMPHLIYGGIL